MMTPGLIVVGASLGGLHAISKLLADLPPGFPVPVVIAQHRTSTPDGGGLVQLLSDHTPLTVIEADDKMTLAPGTVYLAPADYHLLVEERGTLALSTEAPVLAARPSIDVLFETAAEAYAAEVIGVVLTGASADGAEGLATLKARGGLAIVQDPATAECATMPAAAIAGGMVDYVLPIERIGGHLVALVAGVRT